MSASCFLNTGGSAPGKPPEMPMFRRRILRSLLATALFAGGGALVFCKYPAAPGAHIPKPGPRRYGPAYHQHPGHYSAANSSQSE